MKIKESELRDLIQESLQELALEALEEEYAESYDNLEEQEGSEEEEADLEEWGIGVGSASRGAFGGRMGGSAKPGRGDGGRADLAMVAKRDAAKKAAADQEQQRQSDVSSMKSNPFKPTKTGLRAAGFSMQQEAKLRKVIGQLVQEVLAEEATKNKKKPQQKKK